MMKNLWTARAASLGSAMLSAAVLCAAAHADPSAAAGPASPSEAPAKGGGELEEIIVTAEKRESTVQATPIAMTALSASDLSQENIVSLQDLVGAVPGISLRTAGPGQTEYEMRGLASSGGSVATVGFYLDETPLSASAVALNGRTVIDADLYDLNRTEDIAGTSGNAVRRGVDGRHHQTGHQSARAPQPAGFGGGGRFSDHRRQHQRPRQLDAEFSDRRDRGAALRHDG